MHRNIPKQAWKMAFGDVPWNRAKNLLAPLARNKQRTITGIPLGGMGSGSFMYNYTGTFGPWQLKAGRMNRRFLDSAAFHVRETATDRFTEDISFGLMGMSEPELTTRTVARTLAAEEKIAASGNVLKSAWQDHLLQVGSADYYALFPRGWVDYKDNFAANLKMEFFSPIIANNYRESSYPQANFMFSAENPTGHDLDLSIMFTFPNMDRMVDEMYVGEMMAIATQQEDGDMFIKNAIPRKGLKNEIHKEDGTFAIVMSADSPDNLVEVQGSEFCIATRESEGVGITYANWDGDGDGSEVWDDFSGKGSLSGTETSAAAPTGAICVQLTLKPGESREIPFVLTWHFPITQIGDRDENNTQLWWKKYTEFYPAGSPGNIKPQAFHIAADALRDMEQNLAAVEAWSNVYLEDPAFAGKEWVLTSGFNELYYNIFGGSFWESGFIGGKVTRADGTVEVLTEKQFGARDYTSHPNYKGKTDYQQKQQCLHFTMEAQDFPMAETFDVRAHSHSVYTDLWPEIERDILLVYKDFIMDSGDFSCPHDAGSPFGGAFFNYDYYMNAVSGINPEYGGYIGVRKTTPWSEFSPKFILYSYQYWKRTKDHAFLDDAWEAIIQSYIYQRKTDTDNDGITNMKSSEYSDNELFNSVLWIAALEAVEALCVGERKDTVVDYRIEDKNGETIAEITGSLLEDVQAELMRTRRLVETDIWNSEVGYYRFNRELEVLMADAMIGERQAQDSDLPPTLDQQRMAKHLKNIYKYNVQQSGEGEYKGMLGAANTFNLTDIGDADIGDGNIQHGEDAWTGVSYVLAATMYEIGKQTDDKELIDFALDTAFGVYHTTYVNEKTAYFFSTPEAWNLKNPLHSRNWMYQRARGAWELIKSIHTSEKSPN